MRLKYLLCFLCFSLVLHASEIHREAFNTYLNLLEAYPNTLGPLGNWREGEIEIVKDPLLIAKIQEKTKRFVGIMAQDKYWIWLNDAVRFPNGNFGVYGRLLWTQSLVGPTGVAVMIILPDGRVALNCNYRHATRSWELELPRGGVNLGESLSDAAKREVREETGMVIEELISLGEMATDTGVTNAVVTLFLAKMIKQEKAAPEDSEAIDGILAFSLEELLQGLKEGQMEVMLKGKWRKVYLRDPFLAFAILQTQLRGALVQFTTSSY